MNSCKLAGTLNRLSWERGTQDFRAERQNFVRKRKFAVHPREKVHLDLRTVNRPQCFQQISLDAALLEMKDYVKDPDALVRPARFRSYGVGHTFSLFVFEHVC